MNRYSVVWVCRRLLVGLMIFSHLSQTLLWAVSFSVEVSRKNDSVFVNITSALSHDNFYEEITSSQHLCGEALVSSQALPVTGWHKTHFGSTTHLTWGPQGFFELVFHTVEQGYSLGIMGFMKDLSVNVKSDYPVLLGQKGKASVFHQLMIDSPSIENDGDCLLGGDSSFHCLSGNFTNRGRVFSQADLSVQVCSADRQAGVLDNAGGWLFGANLNLEAKQVWNNSGNMIAYSTTPPLLFQHDPKSIHLVMPGLSVKVKRLIDNQFGVISDALYVPKLGKQPREIKKRKPLGIDNEYGYIGGQSIQVGHASFPFFLGGGSIKSENDLVLRASMLQCGDQGAYLNAGSKTELLIKQSTGKLMAQSKDLLRINLLPFTEEVSIHWEKGSQLTAHVLDFAAQGGGSRRVVQLDGEVRAGTVKTEALLINAGTFVSCMLDLRAADGAFLQKAEGSSQTETARAKISDLLDLNTVNVTKEIVGCLSAKTEQLFFQSYAHPSKVPVRFMQVGSIPGSLAVSGSVEAKDVTFATNRQFVGHTPTLGGVDKLQIKASRTVLQAENIDITQAKVCSDQLILNPLSQPARVGILDVKDLDLQGTGALLTEINTFRSIVANAHTVAILASLSAQTLQANVNCLQVGNGQQRVEVCLQKDSSLSFNKAEVRDASLIVQNGSLKVTNKQAFDIIPGSQQKENDIHILPSVIHGEKSLTVVNGPESSLSNISGKFSSSGTVHFVCDDTASMTHGAAHSVQTKESKVEAKNLSWIDRNIIGNGGHHQLTQTASPVSPEIVGKQIQIQGGQVVLEAARLQSDQCDMNVDRLSLSVAKKTELSQKRELDGYVFVTVDRESKSKIEKPIHTTFEAQAGLPAKPSHVKVQSQKAVTIQKATGGNADFTPYLTGQKCFYETVDLLNEKSEKLLNRSLTPLSRTSIGIVVTLATQGLGGPAAVSSTFGIQTSSAFTSYALGSLITGGMHQATTAAISAGIGDQNWHRNIISQDSLKSLFFGSLAAGFAGGMGSSLMGHDFNSYRLPSFFDKPLEHFAMLGIKEFGHCIAAMPCGGKWTWQESLNRMLNNELSSAAAHLAQDIGHQYATGMIGYAEHKVRHGFLALCKEAISLGMDATLGREPMDPTRLLLSLSAATAGAVCAEMVAEGYFNTYLEQCVNENEWARLRDQSALLGRASSAAVGLFFLNEESLCAAYCAGSNAIDNNFLIIGYYVLVVAGAAYSVYSIYHAYEKGGPIAALKQLGIEVVCTAAGKVIGVVAFKVGGKCYPTAKAALDVVLKRNPGLKLASGKFLLQLEKSCAKLSSSTLGKYVHQAESYITRGESKVFKGVWAKKPFTRGKVLEKRMGQNLPDTFPVIDCFDFDKGIATSIKTLDLNAGSYKGSSTMHQCVKGYVDSLSSFNGARMKGVNINLRDIKVRELTIGINHLGTQSQQQVMKEMIEYGTSNNVQVSFQLVSEAPTIVPAWAVKNTVKNTVNPGSGLD